VGEKNFATTLFCPEILARCLLDIFPTETAKDIEQPFCLRLSIKMNGTVEYGEIVKERYKLVVSLRLLSRKYRYLVVFSQPDFVKKQLGCFLRSPLYACMEILKGNTLYGGVYSVANELTVYSGVKCLAIHENKLFFGSEVKTNSSIGDFVDDNAIRIWNTDTHECIGTLRGHTSTVMCLAIHENKLYSGSYDNTIRIWNTIAPYKYDNCIRIWNGDADRHTVWCLAIHENKLYCGSDDTTIRVYNTETHESIATLRGHTNWVWCLAIYENKLYSGGEDKTIRIWNTDTQECIGILEQECSVYSLAIRGKRLYSTESIEIRIWDTDTNKCIKILKGGIKGVRVLSSRRGHINTVNCLAIHKNKLYSGGDDKIIRIWDTDTNKCIKILRGHTSSVKCLALNENKLYSGSGKPHYYFNDEGTICVWCI
jgi:WD40 repeat protein